MLGLGLGVRHQGKSLVCYPTLAILNSRCSEGQSTSMTLLSWRFSNLLNDEALRRECWRSLFCQDLQKTSIFRRWRTCFWTVYVGWTKPPARKLFGRCEGGAVACVSVSVKRVQGEESTRGSFTWHWCGRVMHGRRIRDSLPKGFCSRDLLGDYNEGEQVEKSF